MANVEQLIRASISGIRHLTLGTVGEDGAPWSTELDFVADDDLTLCFRSLATRRHCQNIARDSRVSGTIVRQHRIVESVEGVSFAGRAVLLEAGVEQDQFAGLFVAQLGAGDDIVARAAEITGPQFYAIDVNTWYYYGAPEGGKPQTQVLPWPPAPETG